MRVESKSAEEILIAHPGSGTQALIRPNLGFNCTRFLTVVENKPVEVIWTPRDFAGSHAKLYSGGVPILFPFAGRIRNASFRFAGMDYRLHEEDGMGNALHGLVYNRPWTVLEQTASRITGQFQASRVDPALLVQWPADFELTVTYEVGEKELCCRFRIRNADRTSSLPCSFGIHPYFRVPFVPGGGERIVVTVPASSCWELDSRLLPTGRLVPAIGTLAVKDGVSFPGCEFDHVFGDLIFADHRCRVVLRDPETSCSIWMSFPEVMRCCVVFTPPHGEAISIEPYTSVPDPFFLEAAGKRPGLIVLAPGESCSGWVRIGVWAGNP